MDILRWLGLQDYFCSTIKPVNGYENKAESAFLFEEAEKLSNRAYAHLPKDYRWE